METQNDMGDMISEFNKNKNSKLYSLILENLYEEYKKCKYCDLPILYYDSKVAPKTKKLKGKSFESFKRVNGNKYLLSVCESCLTDKYPDYQNKNKSRVFNQMNNMTKYAFCINDEDYKKQKDLYVLTTKENLVRKHGKIIGSKKWLEYKNKQAYTNSYEYKREKYGWTKSDYDKYNLSRAITLDNLIKKHGKVKGVTMWDDYVEKQKLTKSKDYYINKYSIKEWEKLCKSKAHTFSNYIKWYGDEKTALEKLKKRHNMWNCVSKSSQKYLSEFDNYLKDIHPNINTYYDKLNKEYMIITQKRNIYYLDYYIKEWKICIEYNGDLFHANPEKYNGNDTPIPKSDITASEIWEKDLHRNKTIEKENNISFIIVWEGNLPSNEELLNLIYEKTRIS